MPNEMEILLMTDMTAGPRFFIQGRQVTPVLGGCWPFGEGAGPLFLHYRVDGSSTPRFGNGVGDSTERR